MIDTAQRQITKGTKLILEGESEALQGPLFAINWFDTSVAWVYHLYNRLASGRLAKAGGKPHFKARVTEHLLGDASLGRKHLLIVRYPSAEHFLNLVSDKIFQLFSVLRMVSVRRFSFVMHRRQHGEDTIQPPLTNAYALLHFHADSSVERILDKFQQIASGHGASVVFTSHRAVTVASQSNQADPQVLPFVTHTVVLFCAQDANRIRSMFDSEPFTDLLPSSEHCFGAMLHRTI